MEFSPATWAMLALSAVGFSTLGTLVGLGGGAFMVPVLVLGAGIPLKTAIATVTLCLFPAALTSTILNLRKKRVDLFAGVALEIPTILGTFVGVALVTLVPVKPLETIFSVFVSYMGWRVLRTPRPAGNLMDRLNALPPVFEREAQGVRYRASLIVIAFFGTLSGVLAGLFGIGGGIVKTPVMIRIFKMPAHRATATALFMITFTSLTAAFGHWRAGRLVFELGLPLGACFFVGALIGNRLSGKLSAKALEKLLGLVLIAAAQAILVHAWLLS